MININVTGRLTADAKFNGEGDKAFMTFQLGSKNRKGDSLFFSCIRFVSAEPKNFQSFKKGALVSVSGEPSVNEYKGTQGENRFGLNITVESVQVQSLAEQPNATTE